jgi:formylglycine-generating enzyme required for sulfatase activity
MVVIPAGSYMMGSDVNKSEQPKHQITIDRSFAVGKYEVTFEQWDACTADEGCTNAPQDEKWGRGTRPVINVSWELITQQYIPWINKKTGQTYRLLTEAEWEYAARAGTTTAFHTGATITTDQANFNGNGTYAGSPEGIYRKKTVPVGSLNTPNAFGLHDMHGNVMELVEDCWHADYNGAPTTGRAWQQSHMGDCSRRVTRGSSWDYKPASLRSAARGWVKTDYKYEGLGFRLARNLP